MFGLRKQSNTVLKQTHTISSEVQDIVDYRSQLDKLCSDIADAFDLYDSKNRPRKAFILNTLMKYSCLGCIAKVFKQPYQWNDVNAIYRENHRLAVNILSEHLQNHLNAKGFNVLVQDEVEGDYGRVDVLITPISCGMLVKFRGTEIIIEVKTGKSLSYDQVFKYLLERPDATILVWRVIMNQIFTIEREKISYLLQAYTEMLTRRGNKLLNNRSSVCKHNPLDERTSIIMNPQEAIDEFLSSLLETLPKIIETVLKLLENSIRH